MARQPKPLTKPENADSEEQPSNRAATAADIKASDKRQKILELRENGASIRQISDHMTAQGYTGVSVGSVHKHLVAALDDLIKKQRMKTRHYVQLELNKLDRQELALLPNLSRLAELDKNILKELFSSLQGDGTAISAVLLKNGFHSDDIEKYSRSIERIWKRRDSLLGLHKPIKLNLNPRETLAKLLGTSPENLPNGDIDS